VTDRLQRGREPFEVRVAQMGVFRYFGDGHRISMRFGRGGARRPHDGAQTRRVYEPQQSGSRPIFWVVLRARREDRREVR
jgi:hypothetical protein